MSAGALDLPYETCDASIAAMFVVEDGSLCQDGVTKKDLSETKKGGSFMCLYIYRFLYTKELHKNAKQKMSVTSHIRLIMWWLLPGPSRFSDGLFLDG